MTVPRYASYAGIGLLCAGTWLGSVCPRALAQTGQTESSVAAQGQPIPASISLEPGQIYNVAVDDVSRIAIGKPDVVDVTVVSSHEVLLHAKAVGTSGFILWDKQGQHVSSVEVVDRAPAAEETELRRLLDQLNFARITIERSNGKLFLTGDVPSKEDADRLEQLLNAFPGVTNLVSVSPPRAEPAKAAPLVRLAVQVLEMSRTDVEKLGVKWSETLALTEPKVEGQTLSEAFFRWGTNVTRDSISATLNALVQKNRARVLSEPKLVTASGKEASSFIGLDVPILTATSFSTATAASTASIEFRKTGVLLRMTPAVPVENPDRRITITMEAEVSGIDTGSALKVPVGNQLATVPGFKVRKANTEVSAVSGESIVIAGLLAVEDTKNLDQVPALGSLPVFGRLFRSPDIKATQQEIVIVLTPTLLSDQELGANERVSLLEHALSVAEVTAPVVNPTLRYALQVQQGIARAMRYPSTPVATDKNIQLKLRVHLLRDGALRDVAIGQTSGIDAFDQEAVRAAQSQSPFPAFPPEIAQPDLWLDLPIVFRS